jgi:transcriptional regulatory protein GAL4
MDSESRDDRDQACNECRRRKARCDKTLPECGPCRKNRRHCLYERHSRTPLTRKYLTQVEEQLRRAQLQASRADARANQLEARLRQLEGERARDDGNAVEHDFTAGEATPIDGPPLPLEGPPSGPADFSWDEQTQDTGLPETQAASHESPGEDEGAVDGMASLTVDDNEAGYLGVASGAAMLRLLLPDAHASYKKLIPQPASTVTATVVSDHWLNTPLWDALDMGKVDLDACINSYFGLYHNSYPLVEEHTFRAQYSQVIPRPSGRSWHALAFMIAAVGNFTAATGPSDVDRRLFMAAKSNMSIESLEMGNITLVQTLTLMSNYLQKRNKPNSGYNYLGLALHMAMGLGLHKEFHDWDITPLNMEVRRRVWWCLFVFYVGAGVTFGRPLAWPNRNVEVALPLNVSDRALTNLSRNLPSEAEHITTFSSVIMQSRFHLLTNDIYTRVISMPFPSATELVRLDDTLIGKWESSVPAWYRQGASIPSQFATGHAIMWWRVKNFRIIMYRPYVMRRVLQARTQDDANDVAIPPAVQEAYQRCLREAEASISAISDFWTSKPPTRLSAWYALYFLFQASLIPCVCLRNEPNSPLSSGWRSQVSQTLHTMQRILPINPSAQECYNVIQRLCGPFLQAQVNDRPLGSTPDSTFVGYQPQESTQESPQTQINNVYAMMWPNANPAEVDVLMQDGLWSGFFPDMEGSMPQTMDGQGDTGSTQFPWD